VKDAWAKLLIVLNEAAMGWIPLTLLAEEPTPNNGIAIEDRQTVIRRNE